MKKYAFFALASVLAAGCQTEKFVDYSASKDGRVFEASIESDIESKTSMDGLQVVWSAGDQVTVFAANNGNLKYQIAAGDAGTKYSTLSKVEGTNGSTALKANLGVYPYDPEITVSGTTYWTFSNFRVPSTQTYAPNSFGKGAFPMVAVNANVEDPMLIFKNLCGVVRLNLKGTEKVKSIEFSGNVGEIIAGLANVYVKTGTDVKVSSFTTQEQIITLDCGEGVQLSEASATAFNIVVPPMTFEQGFSAKVVSTEGNAYTIVGSKSATVKRSTILNMPEVNVSEDGVAALTSVKVLKADNPTLVDKDYEASYIDAAMKVSLPTTAMYQPVTVTFGATFGDEISVNKSVIAGGKATNVDSSFPIDVVVTDKKTGKKASYVISFAEKIEYVITDKVYTEPSVASFDKYIDVIADGDNIYTAYSRKAKVGDVSDKYNTVIVGKYDGENFTALGAKLGSATLRSASQVSLLKTSDALYVKYTGGEVTTTSKSAVQKWTGTEWVNTTGTDGATTVNNYMAMAVNSNPLMAIGTKVGFCFTGNTKNTDTYRIMGLASYDGTSWSQKPISILPALGSVTGQASSGFAYMLDPVTTADGTYGVASINYYGYYVLKFNADLSVTKIVDDFKPAGEKLGVPSSNLSIRADKDGNLYVLAAISSKGLFQVYKVDTAKGEMKEYGSIIKAWPGTSGAVSGRPVMGISPKTGEFFIVMDDVATGLPVFSFMDENNQWAEFQPLSNVKANSLYEVVYTSDGTPTVVYMNTTDGVHYINVKEKE